MIDISVIIPVYNVELYLRECLHSVCNQTFKDIEIICINDGSTDSSLDILNEYASKDNRIKIISQDNHGLGVTRNRGLAHATGKYICFLDSDDYIEVDALEKLYNNAVCNKSDVVLFKFQNVGLDRVVHKRGVEFRIDEIFGDVDYNNLTFTYADVRRHVLNSAFSTCIKFYKKEFIDSFDFKFPENIHFEDVPVHVKVMLNAERISFVPEFLYNYRSNSGSILNSTANRCDIFEIIDMVEDYLKENDYYEDFENEFIFFKIAQILVYLITTRSEQYFQKAKREFKSITIKDESTLKKYAIDGYELVLSSDNYVDYLINYYENKLNRLKRKNRKLKKQISKSDESRIMKKIIKF